MHGTKHTEDGEAGNVYVVKSGGKLVFSAPHEEPHTREGQRKFKERGTAALAVILAERTGGSAIYTKGRQLGDPNWDGGHPYVSELENLAERGFVVDLHIMRNRGFEVCLGLGPSHKMSAMLWRPLLDELLEADVRVSLNWPFGGRGRPITSRMQALGIPALQIEMVPEVFEQGKSENVCVISALMRAAERWRDSLPVGR